MEKFVAPAHHVEVQIMADSRAMCFRSASASARFSVAIKSLIEESPRRASTDTTTFVLACTRQRVTWLVPSATKGAVPEFLYSDDGNFYFMEMKRACRWSIRLRSL